MKNVHFLSQHAVSGHGKRGRDDGRDREKRWRIRKTEEAETIRKDGYVKMCEKNRQRKRKTLSQCSIILVMKFQARFQGYTPQACHF